MEPIIFRSKLIRRALTLLLIQIQDTNYEEILQITITTFRIRHRELEQVNQMEIKEMGVKII